MKTLALIVLTLTVFVYAGGKAVDAARQSVAPIAHALGSAGENGAALTGGPQPTADIKANRSSGWINRGNK